MEKNNKEGNLIISLDFEKFWGVAESKKIEDYYRNLISVDKVIVRLLDKFEEYNIKATFAIVGFMLFNDIKDIIKFNLDNNIKSKLDYALLESYSNCLFVDKDLIERILFNGHELASHTFSHNYILDNSNKDTGNIIQEDINNYINYFPLIAKNFESIIFPRNQYNDLTLEIYSKNGFKNFRGNENNKIYKPYSTIIKNNLLFRAIRYIDSLINISGNNTFIIKKSKGMKNIPSSIFLRPYTSKFINYYHIKRIKKGMTNAAKKKENYHIWWHPHNFGDKIDQNIKNIDLIFSHYEKLKDNYGFVNKKMNEF